MNFFSHLRTVCRHRRLVRKYCFKAGLYRQGLLHDLSKFSPAEFFTGVRYYQGDRSPNEAERLEKGYSAAWLHHKGRNKHHLEYWTDYAPDGNHAMSGVKMPVNYVVEMFCDRVAASRIYRGERYTDRDPFDYYNRSRDHYLLHPDTRALLETLLIKLRDEGEEPAFAYIREHVLVPQR